MSGIAALLLYGCCFVKKTNRLAALILAYTITSAVLVMALVLALTPPNVEYCSNSQGECRRKSSPSPDGLWFLLSASLLCLILLSGSLSVAATVNHHWVRVKNAAPNILPSSEEEEDTEKKKDAAAENETPSEWSNGDDGLNDLD
eukprot:CAMPEP_0119009028 /NCGR_PEP_ID=MMETSP1176-20130426/4093_1 /TAXON_ID=265551 /ORGANISM="Synedropsis recta cf, Strain CCMP1620" /LENGTH=144 /DNA_ID=CAMNT_0006961461 /DNA_START=242 /DNA_END=676 /DNA_ORIENTATION=-